MTTPPEAVIPLNIIVNGSKSDNTAWTAFLYNAVFAKYGAKCSVCGFRFSEKYGEIGEQFIHVHHVVPLADIGLEYRVHPIVDLRPVCPNCHAMLHQRNPPYTIQELQQIIEQQPARE